MKVYWIVLETACRTGRGFGITAHDWDDALSLLADAGKFVFDLSVDEKMIKSWKEIRSVEEIEQNHVVPNMGSLLRRGVWFPNLPGIE